MDKKILAILAAVVVVVAAAAAAFVVLGDDDNDNDSDYTILDSNENIKEGLTIKISGESKFSETAQTIKVKSVVDGNVTYEAIDKYDLHQDFGFDDAVSLAIDFDFTDPLDIPEGVTVTESDNVFTIKGKTTFLYQNEGDSYSSEDVYDMEVILDGIHATKVVGKCTHLSKEIEKGVVTLDYASEYTITSNDTTAHIKGTQNTKSIDTKAVGDFFEKVLNDFSKEQEVGGSFEKATVTLTSDSKSYGNVKASSYSVIGDCGVLGANADLAVIVYKGYILEMDGKDMEYEAEIYYD